MFRFALFVALATIPASGFAQFDIEREPINYLKLPLTDPISRLQKRLAARATNEAARCATSICKRESSDTRAAI